VDLDSVANDPAGQTWSGASLTSPTRPGVEDPSRVARSHFPTAPTRAGAAFVRDAKDEEVILQL
jgi:hypothetical protein